MKITDRGVVRFLILMLLIITPLFTFNEVKFFVFEHVHQKEPLIFVKAIKDIFFLLLTLITTLSVIKIKKANVLNLFFIFLISYVAILFFISFNSNYYVAFAGIRWMFPLFLSFLLINYVDELLLIAIAKVLACLFILHFVFQIYELSFMKGRVQNSWGIAARVPGMFSNPNTAGFFAIVTLFFSYMYLPRGQLRYFLFPLLAISIYFTLSGTAFIVLFIFIMMVVLGKKHINKLILIIPFLGYLTLKIVALILFDRNPYWLEVSLGTRIGIVVELLQSMKWLPTNFGLATNTATNLLTTYGDRSLIFVADSTYTSIIANTGLIGLLLFFLMYFFWFVTMIKIKRMDMYLFTMIYSLYGISIIVTESFPMNLLFAIMVAYFLRSVFYLTPVQLKEKAGI